MEPSDPVVSICCITYNQEKFIRDTIEGFLMQKTSFPFEIIIHDDCSTDNTVNIIREYVDKYPDLIKPVYQRENQYSRGVKIDSMVMSYAKGKYISFCEGDDYWTDENKLQRQVGFLDAHSEYVMVTENSIYYNLLNGKKSKFSELSERDIDIINLLDKRPFATASVLFRNLGDKLETSGDLDGDTILWCHLSTLGKIRYLENVSSVYRRHSEGLTGSNLIQWSKKMVAWNNTLILNHPEVDKSVFKERNLINFKYAISDLIKNKCYEQAFFAIDELINSTDYPSEYRRDLYRYVEELLLQNFNSWTFKIGRAVTKPINYFLEFKNKIKQE